MISKIKNKELLTTTLIFLANLFLMIILICLIGIRYETNDDWAMSLISEGFFGGHQSQYLIFSNVVLGYVIKLLRHITTYLNWYMVLQLVLLMLSVTTISQIAYSRYKNILFSILFNCISWIVILGEFLVLQFTTTAAIISFVGLVSIYFALKDNNVIILLNGFLLSIFGFLYRMHAFLLILPFFALFIIVVILRKQMSKQILLIYFCLFLILLGCFAFDSYAYNKNPEWQKYKSSLPSKTKLIDYPNDLTWNAEKCSSIDLDWHPNDYNMIWTSKLDDIDKFNTPNLEKVSEVANRKFNFDLNVIVSSLTEFCMDVGLFKLLLILFLNITFILLNHKYLVLGVLAFLGALLISTYFIVINRFPPRLQVSISISYIFLLITVLFMMDINSNKLSFLISHSEKLLLIFCVILFLFLAVDINNYSYLRRDLSNMKDSYFYNLDKDLNHVYVIDVFTSANQFYFDNPIFSNDESKFNNILFLGGWTAGSPFSKYACSFFGGKNAFDVLANNENALLVVNNDNQANIIECYLQDNYNQSICKNLVTVIPDSNIKIYKITK